jgi:hypothetical protein
MSAGLPAACHSAGPVAVTATTAKVDLATCPLQGRKLFLPRRNGKPVVGLYVPRRGMVTIHLLTTRGSYMLSATISHGQLVVRSSRPGTPSPVVPAIDAACGQKNYLLAHAAWKKTLVWYYNENSVPSGLSGAATLTDIRAGNTNMTQGINNCGYSETGFRSVGSYAGTTGKSANIRTDGECSASDGQSTVSWGPLSVDQVAYDCTWGSDPSTMTESDILLGSNQGIVDTLPANCKTSRDLQSVATHEWGHAFGLGDLGGDGDSALVMYDNQKVCTWRRHLGNGDYYGMAHLYGFR